MIVLYFVWNFISSCSAFWKNQAPGQQCIHLYLWLWAWCRPDYVLCHSSLSTPNGPLYPITSVNAHCTLLTFSIWGRLESYILQYILNPVTKLFHLNSRLFHVFKCSSIPLLLQLPLPPFSVFPNSIILQGSPKWSFFHNLLLDATFQCRLFPLRLPIISRRLFCYLVVLNLAFYFRVLSCFLIVSCFIFFREII